MNKFKTYESNLNTFENDFEKLEVDIQNVNGLNELEFMGYQEKVKNLNELIKKLEKSKPDVNLKISNSTVEKDLIGNIYFIRNELDVKELMNKVKHEKFNSIDLSHAISDVCILSNNHLLISNFKSGLHCRYW